MTDEMKEVLDARPAAHPDPDPMLMALVALGREYALRASAEPLVPPPAGRCSWHARLAMSPLNAIIERDDASDVDREHLNPAIEALAMAIEWCVQDKFDEGRYYCDEAAEHLKLWMDRMVARKWGNRPTLVL